MNDFALGNRICELRTQRRLSRSEPASEPGVTAKAVSKWETRAAKPKMQTLRKPATVFGVSVDELLKLKEVKKRL